MCQPLGQSCVARGPEDYSFRALVSSESMAGGGRTPPGCQSGRGGKGGKSHCYKKGDMLGTPALNSSGEQGKFARKPHLEEASWQRTEALAAAALLTSGPDARHHSFKSAHAALMRD